MGSRGPAVQAWHLAMARKRREAMPLDPKLAHCGSPALHSSPQLLGP